MSLKDLDIRREYRNQLTNVVKEFYNPVLNQSVLYRRAVGFFSSSALISITEGIRGLIENDGRIELIASPRLSAEDIEAIRDGFERRDEVIQDCLLRELKEPTGPFEEARLNLLSNLIASGLLEIKIAFLEDDNGIGMFHEKLGIVYDTEGNSVAFTGSMNDSSNSFYTNYESIDVYTSWSNDYERVIDKQSAFTAMWNDYEPGITVRHFPEIESEIIKKYRTSDTINLDILNDAQTSTTSHAAQDIAEPGPALPEWFKIRGYQSGAIEEWSRRNHIGIFDMATGTGKTFTALAAITHLYNALEKQLAVVIVCPYQHLVEQWKEDIVAFGMRPIVCYSASSQRNWRERVKNSVTGFNLGSIKHFCVVTTNATFTSDFMQDQLGKLQGNCLIVADEAHNFGARKLFNSLPQQFPYRLALSATIERHDDAEGTDNIFSYFGEKCIEYTLRDAICNEMLTPYYYYPQVVYLDGEELEEYTELSKRIGKAIASSGRGLDDLPDSVKLLLIKRAHLVAGAESKISKLREVIRPFKDDNHMLVYCGATTVSDPDYEEGSPDEEGVRQIDVVSKLLGNMGMRVSQFTSKENTEQREVLKHEFDDGKQMQALIAIRCLDEGVNIPSIKMAFILASSTNPKEYVQRRGRVLRTAPGKDHADIYDFVTLPIPLEEATNCTQEELSTLKSQAIRELARVRDFASISENPSYSLKLIGDIIEAYKITPEDELGEAYV